MPYERPARPQHARELPHYPRIFSRVRKEAERREEVEHGIEPPRPPRRQPAHVALSVTEIGPGSPLSRNAQQIPREIEAIHVAAGFCQQMCVTTLATRHIENSRADWKRQQIQQSRYFASITFGSKKRLVLEEIVGVER